MHFCYRPPTNQRSSLEWILWFTQSRFTPAPAEIHLICIRGTHQSVSVSQLQTFAECYRRGEKSFQSHRLGLCSVTDRYPVLLDNRSILWKTAGIREKLASEHFWWNINKNRWVLVAKPDQHSDVCQWDEKSVWNLRSDTMLVYSSTTLLFGPAPESGPSAAAPGCSYGLLPLFLSSWIVPVQSG